VIYVKNLISVSKFYGEVAGLDKTHVESDHVVLESATLQLVVLSIPKDIAALITIETPPARRTEAPIKLVFSVPDLAASRETVAKFGGELNPPEREWKFQQFIVCDGHDPEGNVFQLRANAG